MTPKTRFPLKINLSPDHSYIASYLSLYHVKEPVRVQKFPLRALKATLFCSYDRLMSVSGTGFSPPVRVDVFSHGFDSRFCCLCYLLERHGISKIGEPLYVALCDTAFLSHI